MSEPESYGFYCNPSSDDADEDDVKRRRPGCSSPPLSLENEDQNSVSSPQQFKNTADNLPVNISAGKQHLQRQQVERRIAFAGAILLVTALIWLDFYTDFKMQNYFVAFMLRNMKDDSDRL